ncbi:hypothetical protein [Paraburkholderia caledonica]|jgi:uncharacterized transporter YbjL|uniref:hypothetical protein n=1 Tax=Paraburkholderia caledonica TaxID=134536 RepID=UPI00146FE69D|nr:hypothetical protein [Paraburkholderia caledonica]
MMDALPGFIVFGVSLAAIVAVRERDRKLWWASVFGTLAGGPIVVAALSMAMPGTTSSIEAATFAFLVPVVILSVSVWRQGSPQIAAKNGS